MPDIEQVTVLLADADALRRDGLAAVLRTNSEIRIVAGCSDGDEAFRAIRDLRPDVAVIDLNLPVLHGIELVRRVRGESLGTKIVIVSGTSDDEIVSEVVRAGADGYLLKNGPARHVVDAIHYVRDGGQYFSPQLGRDGRDRHLREEPPRAPVDTTPRASEPQSDEDSRQEPRRRARTADRFRERIRREAPDDLRDRDYEIMSQMADGIRPILDRLDEIEGRVIEMEEGAKPVPADPRSWLNEELADSLSDSRTARQERDRGRRLSSRDMESRLPQMIEEAVTRRFQSMAGKLQEQIEEQHVRTLETFVRNIQVKLVQRVSVLEQNMSQQAQAMHQLREYNQRTEDNLSRLISGVDKLASELPKRLAAAKAESAAEQPAVEAPESSAKDIRKDKPASKPSFFSRQKNVGPKVFWVVLVLAVGAFGISKMNKRKPAADSGGGTQVQEAFQDSGDAAKSPSKPAALPPGSADTKTKLQAAKEAADRKEYVEAEDIYKQVVQAEPQNEEALRGLASVLYRENKLEESAEVLDKLPKH